MSKEQQKNIIPQNERLLRVTRIPLEEYQIAAYYGIEDDLDQSDEMQPTFRDNLQSKLFKSTVLDDLDQSDEMQPTFRDNLQSKLFKSTVLDDLDQSDEMQPTFRDNLQSKLFKSTVLDDLDQSDEMQPTFNDNLQSKLFKSTVLDDLDQSDEMQPTFNDNLQSRLFKSTVLDDLDQSDEMQPTFNDNLQSKLFKSTVLGDLDQSDEMQPTFNDNFLSGLFKSTVVLEDSDPADKTQSHINLNAPKHFRHRISAESTTKISYMPKLIRPDPQSPSIIQFVNETQPTCISLSPDFNSPAPKHFRHRICPEPSPKIPYLPKHILLDPQSPSIIQFVNETETQPKPNISHSPDFNSPAPKHFRHRICAEPSPKISYMPKLIRPDPQSPSIIQFGLRRSKRVRLPRLQSHLGQRAIYKVDNDGNRVLVGATEVELKDRRLKKYRVLDPVVAAEKENEAKQRKKFTKLLMRKRRHERSKPQQQFMSLSNVEEEEED